MATTKPRIQVVARPLHCQNHQLLLVQHTRPEKYFEALSVLKEDEGRLKGDAQPSCQTRSFIRAIKIDLVQFTAQIHREYL